MPEAEISSALAFAPTNVKRTKNKKKYEKTLNRQNQKQGKKGKKNNKVKFNFAKSDGGPTRRHLATNNLRECSL